MTVSPEALPQPLKGSGQAGSVECGALVRMDVVLHRGLVAQARYKAYGCPATLACARTLAAMIEGRPLLEAAAVGERELASAVPEAVDRLDSAALAVDALHAALSQVLRLSDQPLLESPGLDDRAVLVGMSGGVDSSVAALLLRDQGYRVVGVTLGLWSDPGTSGERSCCSPETTRRARRVAHGLGLPHFTLDASEDFYERVVGYFVEGYGGGRTPNPCAKCNARVRFGCMVSLADRLGLRWVATGHYARMMGEPRALARGVDARKDQSYVLAEVDPGLLRRVRFPLGGMTKQEVRARAAESGFEGHRAPESQEICFVPDDDHRRFLKQRMGERPGTIVDAEGRVLGTHAGTYNFTVGQRKGLGLARPAPLYVVRVDADRDEVVVGEAADLDVCEVVVEDLTWHRPAVAEGQAQLRSSGRSFPASLAAPADSTASGSLTLTLKEPARAVAPGQTAVVYDGEHVIVAGTIVRTATCAAAEAGSRRVAVHPVL